MNKDIRNLEPTAIWGNFADLNAIPRASKKEEKVIRFIEEFGRSLGLSTTKDDTGNVIIKKPASKGMENRMPVVLQSHLDMVHQKNENTRFDFNTQGIDMYIDGDWVKANGTTLGADNGIGVASIMSILASNTISHPPLEALFTIDEETGMTGALGLKGGMLDAKILLNLDTEDDRELTIGCAGGIDVTVSGNYQAQKITGEFTAFRISVKGLTGGHSGMDIHKGRGNSNKLLNRVLINATQQFDIKINEIDGGGLRNAIPREAFANIAVTKDAADAITQFIAEQEKMLYAEYKTTDPNITLTIDPVEMPETFLAPEFQYKILRSIHACPNGIFRMSPEISGLVQTSNNVARILIKEGTYTVLCLTRSAVDSEKMDLAAMIRSDFELVDATVNYGGSYPGWTPDPGASIVKLMSELHKELYHETADVNACHAGLECGIIGRNYPGMEMISFGPNIHGAHSPDEKVQVSSVQKFWAFLLETLERIPVKR